ncbi:hypothetical protein [Streptomyces sp. H27-C3]|uniref:hypothetical protein n=1 Tax=Streptomyces sp. H27-C3 TaxID=3046305 RepID=UPI0024B9E903|nr:hypothetical protein [Streptomyces sp. H27-C3]MDJ0463062.1 hypothetical protein [Streptomyces sp. H27-C3]
MGKIAEFVRNRREQSELKKLRWQNKRLVRLGEQSARAGGKRQSLRDWHTFLIDSDDAVLHKTVCREGKFDTYEVATLREADTIVSYVWRAGWRVRHRPEPATKTDALDQHHATQVVVNISDTLS